MKRKRDIAFQDFYFSRSTLDHGETLLVVTTGKAEDVALQGKERKKKIIIKGKGKGKSSRVYYYAVPNLP